MPGWWSSLQSTEPSDRNTIPKELPGPMLPRRLGKHVRVSITDPINHATGPVTSRKASARTPV